MLSTDTHSTVIRLLDSPGSLQTNRSLLIRLHLPQQKSPMFLDLHYLFQPRIFEREGFWPKSHGCDDVALIEVQVYTSCLLRVAGAATAPASLVALDRWEGANVSVQVASHTRSLPFFQGISMILSGQLPSELKRPVASNLDGRRAAVIARWTMSFTAAWRWCRPLLHLQLRPWVALPSTCTPYI